MRAHPRNFSFGDFSWKNLKKRGGVGGCAPTAFLGLTWPTGAFVLFYSRERSGELLIAECLGTCCVFYFDIGKSWLLAAAVVSSYDRTHLGAAGRVSFFPPARRGPSASSAGTGGPGKDQGRNMASRGSNQQKRQPDSDDEDLRFAELLQTGTSVAFQPGVPGADTARGHSAQLSVRLGMWSDVCLRLRCSKDTPVKIRKVSDLLDRRVESVDNILDELRSINRLVLIMPDMQDNRVWQTIWFVTQKRYFYYPRARLLGVATWSHWALLLDWTKPISVDDYMKPDHEYTGAELEGKVQRTSPSRRKYRRQQLESHGGRVAHIG